MSTVRIIIIRTQTILGQATDLSGTIVLFLVFSGKSKYKNFFPEFSHYFYQFTAQEFKYLSFDVFFFQECLQLLFKIMWNAVILVSYLRHSWTLQRTKNSTFGFELVFCYFCVMPPILVFEGRTQWTVVVLLAIGDLSWLLSTLYLVIYFPG